MHLSSRLFNLLFVLLLNLGLWVPVYAQLQVASGQSGATLANMLTGPGVTISNVQLTCPAGASGTFDASNTNIPVAAGVLLTSGSVNTAAQGNATGSAGVDNNAPGDADLNVLSGVPTFDACAIEFDLVATCDTISIAYVLASEEYDEYVCAGVNDAFGFIVNGPGLVNVNIATIPGSTTPVSINTVNNGSVGLFGTNGPNCQLGNSNFYVSNAGGTQYEYDGRTVRLEAKTWVLPCSTYHIKLVVADGGDGVFDSGVFLEEGGIRCASAQISVNTATLGNTFYMVEGCTDALLYFERSGDLSVPFTVHYNIGGSATNGVDYGQIADSVVFAIGADSVGIQLTAPDDGLTEGVENIFIILVDSVCGAQYSDTARLNIVDPPNADFGMTSACPGFPVQFSDSSSFFGIISTWVWDFGDGGSSNQQNPSHVFTSPGTYTIDLLITTIDGCQDSISQTITLYALPTAGFSSQDYCAGHLTIFTDASAAGPGDQLVAWDWDFDDGGSSNQHSPWHTFTSAGIYDVSLIVTNTNGCRDTIIQAITIYAAPQPDFIFNDVCDGETVNFTDQSAIQTGSIVSWNWDMGDGTALTGVNISHIYQNIGTYFVTLVTTSGQACADSIQHIVTVNPNPLADFDISFACMGDTSHFTDLSSILAGSIVNWNWDFDDTHSSTVQNPSHQYGFPGTYNVSLTATSDKGCSHTETQSIVRPPRPPGPIPSHDTVCTGFGAALSAYASPVNGIVEWFYSPTSSRPFHTGQSILTGPLAHQLVYWTQVLSDAGCRSDMVGVIAYVNPPPNIIVEANSHQLEIPHAIVEMEVRNPDEAQQYQWNFGDGSSSNAISPVHQYTETGSFDITLIATDENGCISEYAFGPFEVSQNIALYVPNTFSPNNDGLNDVFSVKTVLITELEIQIFDRWGRLIFQSQDMNFEWNGTGAGGEALPEGAYVYKIQAKSYDGNPVKKSGSVTILR